MNVLLVCEAGMSTSMLVQKMEKYANEHNMNVKIESAGISKFNEMIDNFDVALLAPQVRFSKGKLEEVAKPKGIPVESINTIDYGTMNGGNVLKLAFDAVSKR
ncbi:PTS sugar transporter subunit IIB [Borrelia turcica IST7]|uniref:PTS sugar transporter subunit IIB n=1 Tax=Borrelia turcica IST7 TaxID=1104446 RepID=A0A386PP79_9SPIR|nr:PTS sugar transporter subunit IIB [Borrelia turcica]AYE36697.1 PTS sugar transporter subunit IIB [Borrelia turcica IST7]